MDPNAPRRTSSEASAKNLTRVQRWVMSTLAVTTILHLSAALVIASLFLENPQLSAQIGLNVIAGAFGILAVAAGLVIHGRDPISPWLLLGTIPCFLGIWLTLA